ncbi:MAG: hypothetical protein FLDDKLPJ_01257 [Phycisphaerae bacterium]|nr:hypothetical protein [Phycisphaerae bacterium]
MTQRELKVRRVALAMIAAAVNLGLWLIPSDVATLVARDRHVLLGRYSREHFTWIIGVGLISAGGLVVGTGATPRSRRRRLLGVGAACALVFLPTCAVDLVLRRGAPEYYIKDTLAYHRPPGFRAPEDGAAELIVRDVPEATRSYEVIPPGFPDFAATLTCDRRGFRNATDLPQYDVVVLGDSYAEGSKVSDEHPWPARLAEFTGLTVYNLGMSGYAPQNYLASLEEVGLSLKPNVVLCLLYEENDFRAAELREEPESEFSKFFKQSPLLQRLDAAIVGTLGRMNADGPIRGGAALAWMPLRAPAGPAAKPYAFSPNLMLDLYQTRESVEGSEPWEAIRTLVRRMKERCDAAGARFCLIYAPSKPHVVLPIAGELPAATVRDFAMLRAKEELPPSAEFVQRLLAGLDVKESLTREFCEESGVAFLSLTEPLRRAAASGTQVYFTYDDHFSPAGHEVAALAVAAFLQASTIDGEDANADAPTAPAVTSTEGG